VDLRRHRETQHGLKWVSWWAARGSCATLLKAASPLASSFFWLLGGGLPLPFSVQILPGWSPLLFLEWAASGDEVSFQIFTQSKTHSNSGL
jgi:hypothetical protein